jgi:hypothetical protein
VNNHCDVVADAPDIANGDIVAPASFTCASDQRSLIWQVTLEEDNSGSWQSDGNLGPFILLATGGKTYNKSVRQPCSNEVPPWPMDFRTVIEVRRRLGPPITRISVTASLSCPSPPVQLTVYLNGKGTGRVTSSPAGIDCTQTCSHSFSYGTRVTLTAVPAAGSTFRGWAPFGPHPCPGTGTCAVTLDNQQPAFFEAADFEQG